MKSQNVVTNYDSTILKDKVKCPSCYELNFVNADSSHSAKVGNMYEYFGGKELTGYVNTANHGVSNGLVMLHSSSYNGNPALEYCTRDYFDNNYIYNITSRGGIGLFYVSGNTTYTAGIIRF